MKITLTLETASGRQAELKNAAGEKIIWPLALLPDNVKPGENIVFSVAKEGEEREAKDILNEILGQKK